MLKFWERFIFLLERETRQVQWCVPVFAAALEANVGEALEPTSVGGLQSSALCIPL